MLAKAAVLTVDDDPAVSQAITRDLRRRYGDEYQIVRATSGAEALTILKKFGLRDRPVALIASDQRMPEMTGVAFLEQAKEHAPEAKLVLLTAYADTDVAIKAINDIGLDYYLLKPWDPPDEKLYPVFDDLLSDWHEGCRLGSWSNPRGRGRDKRKLIGGDDFDGACHANATGFSMQLTEVAEFADRVERMPE